MAALKKRELVRFTRPLEEGWVTGYVVDLGQRILLVALVSAEIHFNGFECFRIADIRNLRIPDPHSDFVTQALRLRGERIPKKPRIDLGSFSELLISAARVFPLITIHREKANPDVCHIGRVVDVANGRLELLEIDPDAHWDDEPTSYRLSEITRVSFGGDYEAALCQVAKLIQEKTTSKK
jgi:hypothetical protein